MIFATSSHTIGFSDLCWCVGNYSEIKNLCSCSTLRSREQSTRCGSSSESMWNICLFCCQSNKIFWLSNMADTCLRNFMCVTKVSGLFSRLCFLGADWPRTANSNQQTPITLRLWAIYWKVSQLNCEFSIISMLDLNLIDQPSEGHKLTWYVMQSGFFFSENSIEGIFLFTALAPRLFS